MNYFNLVDTIKSVSLNYCEEFYEGDVYEFLNSGNHKYPSVILTTQNVTTADGINTIGATLFCVDRLTDDSANKLEVQSDMFDRLQRIISTLEENTTNLESNTYTPFTEKFADLCAGMFVEFTLQYVGDTLCDNSIEIKEIELTKNGIYDIIGYDKAIVNVSPYDSLKIEIEDENVFSLIRLINDTTVIEKIKAISDNTTGWTYTFPTTSSAGPVDNGLHIFDNAESITLGCKTISGTTTTGGYNWSIFKLPNLKKLDLSYLENITFGTSALLKASRSAKAFIVVPSIPIESAFIASIS